MKKSNLRATAALQALALLGAGAPVAFFAAAPAAAQDYTRGVLQGTVTDEKGTPIVGAEVTVRSNEQGYQTTTVTDSNGTFQATALATGTYTVIVRRADQTIVEDRAVSVVAGQTNTYGYTAGSALAGAAANQQPDSGGTIVVTGRRIQVDDFATTQTGANIDVAQVASTVPVGRDQTSLILLAPGTTQGDLGFGNLASISGATVAENAYFVNGLNITDFRAFLGSSIIPFEFYRTLDVKTGGYQAEYGRALGGVTSAVTKSGTNTLSGGAVVSYAPDFLRKDSPNTYAALNEDDRRTNIDGNFYLSGPVIRDRFFLYGLYSPRFLEIVDTGITGRRELRTTSDSPFWGIKADAVIMPGHRLEGTFFSDKQTQVTDYREYFPEGRTAGPAGYAGSLGAVKSGFGGRNYIGTYTGQFTDFFTLSASYGVNKDRGTQDGGPRSQIVSRLGGGTPTNRSTYCEATVFDPLAPSGATGCGGYNAAGYVAGGTVAGNLQDFDERKFYRADADVYVNLFGKHHFRAGFDYEDLTAEENTSYTGNYQYQVRRNLTIRTYYQNDGTFETNQRAFYLQDSWTTLNERLTLNLGVRNDRFRNYTETGEKYYDSKSQWAPRLGATFDVFGDKRTKLNAFWGKYYLPIATNTNIRLAGSETYYNQIFLTGTGSRTDLNQDGIPDNLVINPENNNITNLDDFFNLVYSDCPEGSPNAGEGCYAVYGDGELGPTDTLVAQGLKPSESTEFILGLSHRFGDGWTAGVDYARRRLGETLEDVAIDQAVVAYCEREGIAGCENVFYGFHQYVLTNPGSDITVRLDGDCDADPRQCEVVTLTADDLGYPKAVRKYDSVQFTLDKAFNGFYGFNFNYVYTKLRGNFEGGVKSDNNQTDTGLTQDFDQPGLTFGAFGTLANERKHAFKLYGHVQPLEWLDVGVNVLVQSPRKFSCIGNFEDPADPAYQYGAASYYCQQERFGGVSGDPLTGDPGVSVLVPRGTAFKSQWAKQVDMGFAFDLGVLGEPLNGSQFRVDVFNIFNWKQKLDFDEFGDFGLGAGTNPNFGDVLGYQAPRSVRFTLATRFGQAR
jgi:hypothetical protein